MRPRGYSGLFTDGFVDLSNSGPRAGNNMNERFVVAFTTRIPRYLRM